MHVKLQPAQRGLLAKTDRLASRFEAKRAATAAANQARAAG